MATCVMAYIRDSWNGSAEGAMHAAVAATPAFAFHTVTALLGRFGKLCNRLLLFMRRGMVDL